MKSVSGVPVLLWFTLLLASSGLAQATFQKQTYPTGLNPVSIVSGDFNGDGRKDVAIAAYDDRAIVIHYGNADGTYGAPVVVSVCGFPKKVVMGNFNGTGPDDVASLNDPANDVPGCGAAADTVSLVFGNSNTSVSMTLPAHGLDIAAGQIDGIGGRDVAILMEGNLVRTVRVQAGAPPTLASTDQQIGGQPASTLAAGEFTGDGKADLLLGSCCYGVDVTNGRIDIFPSNGDGTYGASIANVPGEPLFNGLVSADFNDDGKQDIVTAQSRCGSGGCDPKVRGFKNLGSNTFAEVEIYDFDDLISPPLSPVVGDFTGDGRDDVAFVATDRVFETGGDYVFVIRQNSDGSFAKSAPVKFLLGHDLGTKSLAWTKIAGTSALADLLATHAIPNWFSAIKNTTDQTGGLTCNPPRTVSVSICLPQSGATVNGSVRLLAAASVFDRVYRFEVWEGSTKLYTGRNTNVIDTPIALPSGAHTLTFVARNETNTSRASKSVSFTVSDTVGDCAIPATNGINVCSPVDGSTVGSSVPVKAAARVSGAIYRFELWIDGAKAVTVRDDAVMNTGVTLSPGAHRFDFAAYNEARTSRVTKTVRVTVK